MAFVSFLLNARVRIVDYCSAVPLQNAYCFTSKFKVMQKKKQQATKELSIQIINQNAAGIDVDDMLLSVAVPPGRDEVCIKEFGAFTEDLHAIAQWLRQC